MIWVDKDIDTIIITKNNDGTYRMEIKSFNKGITIEVPRAQITSLEFEPLTTQ